ncbi:Gp19/Gp15/Gp42 family protein [Bifidobacterium tissieri]|uniref:Gp19/Gp15/Gp42 family protein n=1 Tax=Bifidobacterium tissieri TaxID=1630162 RepID=UPI001239B202|nr:Gp19/Gp15/Gp42 family protein [Bifidobacterium tissieri]KAA8832610.1 hypothetical protein EM849_03650 [Bifidobacterium tissieri]
MADITNQTPVPPFATVADLEDRWHALTPEEAGKAEKKIGDAADVIISTCPYWREARPGTLRRIVCAMVQRALSAPDYGGADVTQASQTVGQVSLGLTYSNPAGDLYLTKWERKALGCTATRFWSIDLSNGEATV